MDRSMDESDELVVPFGARLMQETLTANVATGTPAEAALSRQTTTWNQGEDTHADD